MPAGAARIVVQEHDTGGAAPDSIISADDAAGNAVRVVVRGVALPGYIRSPQLHDFCALCIAGKRFILRCVAAIGDDACIAGVLDGFFDIVSILIPKGAFADVLTVNRPGCAGPHGAGEMPDIKDNQASAAAPAI